MIDFEKSIFIPIAACEERFIEQTIKSALINAEFPENIYIGIFNNIIDKEHSLLNNSFITEHPQIFYTEIVTPCPMGTGFARMNASLLQFIKCKYMFQIDAHTLFTKNWDTNVINYFNKIKNENNIDEDKLILSANGGLSWSYNPNNLDDIFIINYQNSSLLKINPFNLEEKVNDRIEKGLITNKFVFDGAQGKRVYLKGINFPTVYGDDTIGDLEYKEINCVHGTFMFSKSELNREVLHDPEDLFDGDQTNYSLRLISRGYRIFTPKQPVLAVLDKFIVDNNHNPDLLDPEHNWRSMKYKTNGDNYHITKGEDDRKFFYDIISGNYFGYWGAIDKESLEKAKRFMGYESGR